MTGNSFQNKQRTKQEDNIMSKNNRVWYVSYGNQAISKFVANNISGFDVNSDFLMDRQVFERGGVIERTHLARLPSKDSVTMIRRAKNNLGLKYKIYVQESRDTKIVRWIGDDDKEKPQFKKASEMHPVG